MLIVMHGFRDCLEGVHGYVTSTDELLTMLTKVRVAYDHFMKMPSDLKKKLKHLSKRRTVKGGLEEVQCAGLRRE